MLNGAFREAVLLSGFEFGLGMVQARSWPQMLAPYTFTDGNVDAHHDF
jgi:hypothetical protein